MNIAKDKMSVLSFLSHWNSKLSFDVASYLQDREELSILLRVIIKDASDHRNHKGKMAMVNGASGVAAGVVGMVALAAMPTTLGLTAPLAIVGNSMAAASMASSAASYGYSHAVDKDVALRLHNLRCIVETIAKKDEEINVILKGFIKQTNVETKTIAKEEIPDIEKESKAKSEEKSNSYQQHEKENKHFSVQIQQQPIQACHKLQVVCEQLDLAKLAESTDLKSMAIELPVSVLNTQGIFMGTRSMIRGSKQIQTEEELEEGLASAADLLDQETHFLHSRECKRRFKYFKSITSQKSTATATKRGGRLTYIDGGGGCSRKMIVVFYDPRTKATVKLESDSSNVVRLSEGATNIQVHFVVKGAGGKTVKRVDRAHPNQPWIKVSSIATKELECAVSKKAGAEKKRMVNDNQRRQSWLASKPKSCKNPKQVDDDNSQLKQKQPWAILSKEASTQSAAPKTTYEIDVFEFRHGDGIDAVFYVEGSFTHSYVSKAWDFGRSRYGRKPHQSWEFWENAEEECQKLLPGSQTRIRQQQTWHSTR